MDIESNKNIDNSIVKPNLAEEYLEKNKIQEIPKSKPATVSYNIIFINLAKKIAENEELFCQLEYLKRKSPADDVLNNLKLIEQNLLHRHQTFDISKKRLSAIVNIYDETPLAVLGLVAQHTIYKRDTTIVANQQAAAICYLFTQLCHEVGLGEVSLLIRKEEENINFESERHFETPWKSTGVITENSDLELAAAAFVTSSSTCFWKLQRILVQESMFEAFRKALVTLIKPSNQFEALNKGSTELVISDKKMFWINVLEQESAVRVLCGKQAASPHIIFVRAYKNVPELLSLLTDCTPKVVSLWTSDIAEASDITQGITSSLVWVNTFGNFDGPPVLSQWFYTDISIFHFCAIKVCSVDENLGGLVEPWKSYDMETRLNLICQVLETYRQKDESNDILKLQESMSQFRIDQSVYCYKGSIVIILELPADMVYYYRRPCQSYEDLKGVIKLLVKGDALLVDCTESVLGLMRALRDAGVPVFWASAGDAGRLYIRHDFINRKRAIQINLKSFAISLLSAATLLIFFTIGADGAGCPPPHKVPGYHQTCHSNYDCHHGQICCPNQSHTKSCTYPSPWAEKTHHKRNFIPWRVFIKYDILLERVDNEIEEGGPGVYCNGTKCRSYEICKPDFYSKKLTCQRA